MGCLVADIRRKSQDIVPTITKGNGIACNIQHIGGVDAEVVLLSQLHAASSRCGEALQVKVGMVCSIPEEMLIRFAQNRLVWEGDTNNEGVILYNTLYATGDWSLEEIYIEELL